MPGKLGAGILDVAEWDEGGVQLIFQVSYLIGKDLQLVLHVGILLSCLR